ncbi:UDP-N-acetylmuramoyl-tripeptide--D-alanyl-D-alanine ligase [Chryseosolibacter indicus]|uniref:UDP-N-acetylmuramoyl-tripeptide--D-alanyl-D-alanine ligase n=1 Tax=Chryseosolibacter indicus TaxID=2782351 RepID=A0ABS5VME1_9BACT|nr:UDP-N-acetylmuramoyl-tripeptide--D-alanyl-D-alanine ligase [Chryseosolibacter indicus]MBT1702617.1 UDP-N-acetylmuramoyl-tripeptide--D-alanyl-D-alanine ligase [Chryseosolibacter indicus]
MKIENLYQKFIESGKVSTDTRQITSGSIFFALKGDKFNANEFAEEALKKGASYSVIDEEKYNTNERCLLVDDVLNTLQKLARYHRDQLRIPVIGLTGSNGKTTSKELVNAVLSKKFKTYATRGNLNNHIGVPLTLLAIDKSVEIAVVEMGANHLGEIALLSSIANPTHGFITNIGKAHIGTFGGFENIIKGKSELYQHLLLTGGQVFINSQNEILARLAKQFTTPILYPQKGDYYHAQLLSADPIVKVLAENGEEITTNLIGAYNFENIAAALCIGKFFGVDAQLANRAIAEYVPSNMRSQVVRKNSNAIILDAYNANPSSMQAAIENIAAMNVPKKVLILGDMFELEDEAAKEHQEIGRLIKEKGFEQVYLCGALFKTALHEIPKAKYFAKKDELIDELKTFPIKDATILVKASRGIGLETIVDYL